MMPQYEFDKPKSELLTSVVCHYTDEGKEDESSDDESGGKTEGVVTFEFLKGSALSGTFTWADKALDVNKPGVVNVPELLNIQGGATGVARVQWQNTAKKYLMISHINEATFPTTGTKVLVGASSSATFTFNAATGRMKTKYGIERPLRMQRTLSSNLGIIRDEIVARLVGRTDLEIIRSKFQTIKYPIVYHNLVDTADPPASTASRSGNTITWTGAIAARDRGIRKGHIVAEINDLGQYVRYAYISLVNNDRSITYGTGATDTSDGTALDVSNIIRLVIPLRPGDVIKVVNIQSGVDTDQVILSLGYDENPGMFAARYETVGSNNKFNNIFSEAEELRAAIAAVAPKKFPDPKSLGETSFAFDGFVNRGVNPSGANDYRQIHWTNAANDVSGTSGKLTAGDGTKFTIACANSAILTTAEHTIFFRPLKARATANKSDTTFQIVLTTSYNKDPDDILVGWGFASANKAGSKAVLVLAPQFSSKDLFASGQNGTLTEALLSKSAQEYSSGLEITPVTSGFDGPPSTRWQQVTWAACTSAAERLTFGDGDYWSIAAKSGSDYSLTENGSSYTTIQALAANSTYYVFIDTADTASTGTLTLRFTTSYSHISTASDGTFRSSRVIMGQIAVPANGDNGAAPRIFPFNNRSLTVNAASIAADSITATHVTANAIDTNKLTVAAQTLISEKTITTVASSAPTSPAPRTGDIWFDTSDDPTVIKVYDSTTSPYWFERNSNDAGSRVFRNDIDEIPTTANSGGNNVPDFAVAQYDLWFTGDTNQVYVALHATTNDSISTGEWTLKNDADAINYAGTEINGGLIRTQRIKLLEGGSLNITDAGNALETTVSTAVTTSRRLTAAIGTTSATTIAIDPQTTANTIRVITSHITSLTSTTFNVDSQTGSELSIDVGDVVKVNSEEMLILAAVTGDTVYTVSRGWRGTTATTHTAGDAVHKYLGKAIMAGDVIQIGSEDMSVTSSVAVGDSNTALVVVRGWNNTDRATYADNTIIWKYVTSMVGLSRPHIILDNTGITGYSDAFTPEFSLSSVTGQGTFGAGNSSLGASGIDLRGEATSISFIHGEGMLQIWATETDSGGTQLRRLFINSRNSGGTYQTDPQVNFFAPHVPGTIGLGHHSLGPWGTIYANLHYLKVQSEPANSLIPSGWGALYVDGTSVKFKIGTTAVTIGGTHNHDVDNALLYAPITGSNVYGDIDSVQITASGGLQSSPTNPVNTQSGNHIQNISHVSSAGYYHVPSAQSAGYAYFPTTSTIASASGSSLGTTLYCTGIKVSTSYIDFDNMGAGAGTDVELDDGYLRYNSSSRRYKENIVDLVIDSSKIYDLVPKSFKMKDWERPTKTADGEIDFDTMETKIGLTTFGLIAEEVHEVLPELVIYNKDNEPDSVRYKTIAVLLIEEMKKLRARIEVLEGV
jgi:hypothetical protein